MTSRPEGTWHCIQVLGDLSPLNSASTAVYSLWQKQELDFFTSSWLLLSLESALDSFHHNYHILFLSSFLHEVLKLSLTSRLVSSATFVPPEVVLVSRSTGTLIQLLVLLSSGHFKSRGSQPSIGLRLQNKLNELQITTCIPRRYIRGTMSEYHESLVLRNSPYLVSL